MAICLALILLYGSRIASNSVFFNAYTMGKFLKKRPTWVIPGSDGWLFYRESLKAILKPWKYAESNERTIASLNDSLAARGIKLIVVPVPDKEEIVQAYTPFRVYNASNQRSRMIARLREHHIEVVDLFPSYMASNPREELYQKKDTHWDEPGIEIAAQVIGDSVNRFFGGKGDALYAFKDTFVYKPRDLALFRKDSTSYANACRMVSEPDGTRYRDSIWSDILIFGDSYSLVNYGYGGGIGPEIARFTGRPNFTIGHIGFNYGAPSEMWNFVKNRRKVPKVLVWVFVSRFFLFKIEPL